MLAVLAGWVYWLLISVGGFLGDGQHGGVQGGVGDDRDHRGVGDPQPGDPADPQLGVHDRAGIGAGPIRQVPAGW